jgi:hypothetical protein
MGLNWHAGVQGSNTIRTIQFAKCFLFSYFDKDEDKEGLIKKNKKRK